MSSNHGAILTGFYEMRLLKSCLMSASLVALGTGAMAQQVPDAGRQLQQIPPTPELPRTTPDLAITPPAAVAEEGPTGGTVNVVRLQLTGNTLFSEADLIAASGFTPGAALTLSDLRRLAGAVSAYYHKNGYFLARAYLPAQEISAGSVTIAIIEGRYGQIELRNRARVADGVARSVLKGLTPGDPVAAAPLERRLLLLSDLPGVKVRSTLSPGAADGTSDLVVDLDPGRRVTGSIEADNGGNRYTGEYRLGGTVNINNPTGRGDLASFRALVSNGGLLYGRAAYQMRVGNATIGAAYAHIEYELGREFRSLNADGSADLFSLFGSYPLVRSRRANLHGDVSLRASSFHDRVGVTSTVTDRSTRAATAGLRGDVQDSLGAGGWTVFSVDGTVGNLDIDTPAARALDAATARAQGGYGKVQLRVARLQTLTQALSLYGSVRGQFAFNNLDSSEQMSLGGPYGVRAYPEGEAYGDEGYVANMEVRLLLPAAGLPGQLQLAGFVDVGAVRIAKDPWFPGSNSLHRSGYGASLSWARANDFMVTAAYARKLGSTPATSAPDRSGRLWVQIVKFF
jgi:hemolysin activation/secretion protein